MLYVPHFQNNLGIVAASTTTTGMGISGSNSLNQFYSYDVSVSPRLWLGYQGDSGLGVRTRWWHFEQASQEQGVAFPAVKPGLLTGGNSVTIGLLTANQIGDGDPIHAVAQYHLHLDVWDFEATDEVTAGRWSLLFAGGVRYAYLSQGQNANLTGDLGGVTSPTTQVGFVGHNFSGVGPTVALDARRPLGDSGFALFGGLRGAVLFGRDRVNEFGSSTDLMTNVTTNSSSLNSELGVVPVLEYEIGIEWARTVGRYRFFFRPAFAGEVWFGGATDDMVGLPTPTPTSKGPAANLGFIGMSLNTGFTF